MTTPPPAGATFAFDTAVSALDEQLRRVDGLDAKAGILLAADGVILGLFLRSDLPVLPTWVGSAGSIAILVSVVAAIGALLNRRYELAPNADAVARLISADADWIRWRLLGNVLEAVRVNRGTIRSKARVLTFGQAMLLAALVIAGGYSIVGRLAGGA